MNPMINLLPQFIKQNLPGRSRMTTNSKRNTQINKRKRPNLKPQHSSNTPLNSLGSIEEKMEDLFSLTFGPEATRYTSKAFLKEVAFYRRAYAINEVSFTNWRCEIGGKPTPHFHP